MNIQGTITTKSKARAIKGMTLVEVVVAMLVLTLVSAGVLSCAVKAFSEVARATVISRETAILNDKIEEMRAMQFASLVTSLSTADKNIGEISTTGSTLVEKLFSGNNVFVWDRTLVSSSSTLVTVTVSVWTKNKSSQKLSVTTQISKRGLSAKPAA